MVCLSLLHMVFLRISVKNINLLIKDDYLIVHLHNIVTEGSGDFNIKNVYIFECI